jgi:glycosyltransferase involved in cell wall biosynthesis
MRVADTAVIVPAYNEARVVGEVLSGLTHSFDHVVCVDDGSTDDTSAQARAAGALTVRHAVNLGAGAATQTGIDYALRLPVDYLATFDADGQHRVEDLLAMRQAMIDSPVDIVLGSRFLGTQASVPRLRRLMLRAAVAFSNLTTGLKLTDTHIGLRLFTRRVAQLLDLQEAGYRHASELTEKIAAYHLQVKEVPVSVHYTSYSTAKGQPALNAVNIVVDTVSSKVLRS